MKKFDLTASVDISMEIIAENLEEAQMLLEEQIYDALEDLRHSVEDIEQD